MLPSGARKCTQAFPLSSTPDSKRIATPADRSSVVAAWMSSTRNPATGPVVKWRLIGLSGPKTRPCSRRAASASKPRLLELEPEAQDVTEEGDGGFGVVGSGAHPGQLHDPHTKTTTRSRARQAPRRLASWRLAAWLGRAGDYRCSVTWFGGQRFR